MTRIWHYAIVKHELDGETLYSVAEVYYLWSDKPNYWCDASLTCMDSETDLKLEIVKIIDDLLEYPILSYPEDFEQKITAV